MQVEIIFENEDFWVVDKSSGLVVHTDNRTSENTLADWLEKYCKDNNINFEVQKKIGRPHTLDSGRYVDRLGVVNRLDRDTSGLILIAKNEKTFEQLQNLFQERKIVKKYIALVWGDVEWQEKYVDEKISRHKTDPRIWTCGLGKEEGARQTGLAAQTNMKVLSRNEKNNTTLLELVPHTGRTHQLRLHCRYVGHPIVGDKKYGLHGTINEHSVRQVEKYFSKNNLDFDEKSRLCLHAKSLQFCLAGKEYFFESNIFF